MALRDSLDQKYLWQKATRTLSHWSFQGRRTLRASLRNGWWAAYCSLPLLVVTVVGATFAHHIADFWPFYILILLVSLLVRYKEDFAKYGSICAALVSFAYVIYQSEQSTTVIAPFAVHSASNAQLPFSGETVANVVRDGLEAVGKVAMQQPGRFPCANNPVPSDISRALSPKDASLGIDLQPVFPILEVTTAAPIPEPVTLEVKGVSLNALLSAARSVLRTERVISGDLIGDGSGSFFMIARSKNGDGPWSVGPYATTKQGLQDASCQMAEYILKDINPNLLGEAYINSSRTTDVVVLYNEQVSADIQNSHDALMLDGAARMQMKNYSAAISKFREALRARKDDPRTLESLGLAYAGAGDYDNAFKQFDLALECPPFVLPCSLRARNYYDRGVAFFLKQDYNSSVNAFQQALKARPEYCAAAFYLGEAFQESKRYAEAIEAYQTALKAKPAHPSDVAVIQLQLGNALALNRQPDKAIAAYQLTEAYFFLATAFNPENLGAYYSFALINLRIGTVQAENHLEVAGKKDNGAAAFAQGVRTLDIILSKNSEYPEARTYLAKAHMLLGNALFETNKDDPAIRELSEAISEIEQMSKSQALQDQVVLTLGTAFVLRGNIQIRNHRDTLATTDSKEAVETLSKIPASSPQSGEARQWLARALTLDAHVQTNATRYQNAIEELNVALKLCASYPEASRALAMAYTDLGTKLIKSGKQIDEAQKDFTEAIKQLKSVQGQESSATSLLGQAYLGSAAAFELENQHKEAKAACDDALDIFRQIPEAKSLLPGVERQCAVIAKGR